MDLTILYYTSNRENEYFENKVVETIMANKGDLPVVSVSQKPISFGYNICVGQHDNCYHNEFRQIQIGLREIKTPYVIIAESDTLYPPEYFSFRPSERKCAYRYDNVWVHYTQFSSKPKFWFKGKSHSAQVLDRDMWLKRINKFLNQTPEWTPRPTGKVSYIDHLQFKVSEEDVWTGNPVVTCKTRQGIKSNTATKRGVLPKYSLPYWGGASSFRKKYLGI